MIFGPTRVWIHGVCEPPTLAYVPGGLPKMNETLLGGRLAHIAPAAAKRAALNRGTSRRSWCSRPCNWLICPRAGIQNSSVSRNSNHSGAHQSRTASSAAVKNSKASVANVWRRSARTRSSAAKVRTIPAFSGSDSFNETKMRSTPIPRWWAMQLSSSVASSAWPIMAAKRTEFARAPARDGRDKFKRRFPHRTVDLPSDVERRLGS